MLRLCQTEGIIQTLQLQYSKTVSYNMAELDGHANMLYCLQMLGMHGTVFANFAVDEADLLLAFGVRFDDRVTGKLETFAAKAKIVHIDIDPAEISKNKEAHVMVCSDIRPALRGESQQHVQYI